MLYFRGPAISPCPRKHSLTSKVIPEMFRSVTSLAALICLSSAVIAHEGHGHPEHQQGVSHYLVNPSHALPILLSVAAIAGIGFLIGRSVKKWHS
jgi:hypothetical protein